MQVVVPVEGHAQRRAADVREDFPAFVVGREESDDVPVSRAAVQVVVAVQDDVFRALDLTLADDVDILQLVVERPNGAAVGLGRRRRREFVVRGADIRPADDPMLVFHPPVIDCRSQ